MSKRSWFVLACGVWLCSCATTVSSECKQDIANCLKRCESADPDTHPALASPPQSTQTECEARCQCRAKPSKPAPMGRPTPTGTAP